MNRKKIYEEFLSKYDEFQLKEMKLGLESRVNISLYANPKFNQYQMKEIRLGLEEGLDISWYMIFK